MTHLRGFMSAGGPLSNLKLLGFFIFENRNSLEVLSQCFILLDFDKSVTVEKSVSIDLCLAKAYI